MPKLWANDSNLRRISKKRLTFISNNLILRHYALGFRGSKRISLLIISGNRNYQKQSGKLEIVGENILEI